jgi:hypothetical protein
MIVIVGGGISGLYMALRLVEAQYPVKEIVLLEQSGRFGGCVLTYSMHGVAIEAGAGRIHQDHKLLRSLITLMNLENKLKEIPNKTKFVSTYNVSDLDKLQFSQLFDLIDTSPEREEKQKELSFFAYACEYLPVKEVEHMRNTFGFTVEFEQMNAYDAIRMFHTEFAPNSKYSIVQGGLNQLTERLVHYLQEKGVNMYLNCKLLNFTKRKRDNIYDCELSTGKQLAAHKLVLCLPRHALRKLSYLKENENYSRILKTVAKQSIIRIYARIPKLKQTCKITTDSLLRYIIPIKDDLYIICYNDGRYADYWKEIQGYSKKWEQQVDASKNYLKYRIAIELNDMFDSEDFEADDIEDLQLFYWKDCVHHWKPGSNSDYVSTAITRLEPNLFVASESYSKRQAWIEGALEQVQKVMGHF